MKKILATAILVLAGVGATPAQESAQTSGCLGCHEGIEQFVDGLMHEQIVLIGEEHGDPAGCVTCHGGNPSATEKDAAHAGAPIALTDAGGPHTFYPDPGAIWISDKSCGQCHAGYAERVQKSLMNTEAGKLQGNLWSWGVQDDMKVVWGNYTLKDEDGPEPSIGTEAYVEYIKAYVEAHPDQMPSEMTQVPEVNPDDIAEHPNLAGITYIRHLGFRTPYHALLRHITSHCS